MNSAQLSIFRRKMPNNQQASQDGSSPRSKNTDGKGWLLDNPVFQLLSTVYGPYAFGVVSLLIIWYSIVSPQLERQAIDYQKNEEVVASLRSISQSMESASRSMERTALILDRITDETTDQ